MPKNGLSKGLPRVRTGHAARSPLRPKLTPPPPTLRPPHSRGAARAAGFAPANVDPVDSVDPVFQFTPARDSR